MWMTESVIGLELTLGVIQAHIHPKCSVFTVNNKVAWRAVMCHESRPSQEQQNKSNESREAGLSEGQ